MAEMTLEELKKKKMHGDWLKVAEKTGLSVPLCMYAISKASCKHHIAVIRALREVVEQHEKDLREALGQNQ